MNDFKRGSDDDLWMACIHCGELIHIKTIENEICPFCGDAWHDLDKLVENVKNTLRPLWNELNKAYKKYPVITVSLVETWMDEEVDE